MNNKIRVGLYGMNGHQIHRKLKNHLDAELVAVCGVTEEQLSRAECYEEGKITFYNSLKEMLADERLDLISLCSPKREDQADDAIACLKAGKHVYAEKPAALSQEKLDEILVVAKESGCEFHEMADTVFCEPYWTMRRMVRSGKFGEVVQVYVQKSYPLQAEVRPQDEVTDGGLIRQAGIHAIRFLEHITGVWVKDVQVVQTHLGNIDRERGLFTASSWVMTLENGGVASACVNYLNPKGFGRWGNETVRVFGTEGMIEVVDGSRSSHIYMSKCNEGAIDISESDCVDFFDQYMSHLRFGKEMPMSLEEELHPLRVVLIAFEYHNRMNLYGGM